MAIKQLGTAESNNADAATKGYVDSAISTKIQAADGDGLTNSGDVLAVNTGSGLEISSDAVRIATSAAGTGLTGGGGSALSVSANYRSIAIPFHISGAVTTGVKAPKFIAPVAMTVVDMRTVLASGSGTTTVRPSKNGGTSDGSPENVTTSTQTESQSLSLAAGDTLTVYVSAIGTTPTDLSVTFWANIT